MKVYHKIILSLLAFLFMTGCERDLDGLDEATFPTTPEVFIDGFSAGLNYAAFGGSDVKAFDVDEGVSYQGTASMRIAVPDRNDPKGAYAGGVYYTSVGRDLSSYNVLAFWAKASKAANVDLIGFGNDLGENKYQAAITNVPVNTNWQKYHIPIPDASKLTNERGMFFYSEGAEGDRGYTFWIDEVKFENLGTVKNVRGRIQGGEDVVVSAETGATYNIAGIASANLPNGIDQQVQSAPAYFEFSSSNPGVASVSTVGEVKVMDAGAAVITAKLGGLEVQGSLTVNSTGAPVLPASPAPKPDRDANKVISLFSNEYTNVPVDFFNGYWQFSTTQLANIQVSGDDILRYSQLNFVGIQFTAPTINATEMTHLHMDIWTPDNVTASSVFKVLLVDIGADGSFEGNDNSSHELTIPSSMLVKENWISLDLPLSSFAGLRSRSHLAQIVLSGDIPNVFADNIYFYDGGNTGGITDPTVAAPTPTAPASNVISVFSDAYTNLPGTDFNPNWGQGTVVSQMEIEGNKVLKYAGLNYQGTQLGSNTDVSEMEFLHLDYWSSSSTALNVFLISPGPKETAFALEVPTMGWNSIDIPLSTFKDVDLKNVIQFKFDGNGTVFLDNIYFYKKGGGSGAPLVAAPTPTAAPANVISVFSDVYTNIPGTDFNPNWGQATLVSQLSIAGSNTLKLEGLNYQGIQLGSSTDVTSMEFLHLDYWTANATALNVFLISPGPKEKAFALDVPTSGWKSIDIPLSAFDGVDLKDVIQFKFDGNGTIYLDNIYFYKKASAGGTTPTVAAPAPTLPASSVISLFSDAYTDVKVDTWRTDWSSAKLEDVSVAGNAVKKYSELDFVGIETVANKINASEMTHFHIDVWSPNFELFAIKLVDFGPDGAFGGGDDKEHQVNFTMPAKSSWVSLDIPLTDFVGLTTKSNMSQYILVGQPTGAATVYVDNVYFHK